MLQEAPCAVRVVRARSEEHTKSDIFNVILAIENAEHRQTLVDHVLEFPGPNTQPSSASTLSAKFARFVDRAGNYNPEKCSTNTTKTWWLEVRLVGSSISKVK